ncbi:hypothetical protein CAG54_11130 [Vibrio sp. V27_P1S3P104]|uniref:TraK domain-containing protein n=1 Tax=unclassified Vibrio TaxID=2614977 RepID=UPI001372F603|nr:MULTISPECIES: type-F conjugative transfer system secretin TraK [unclassified Vibrio]NAX35473.1 hypothetical protein [Vibrio sp. V29_P1S30P107]NAX38049.1 hypothetical protein [Vibrio sp. V27_P1S3P104]
MKLSTVIAASFILVGAPSIATDRALYPVTSVQSEVANKDPLFAKRESETYEISNLHINRIVTPFSNPSIKLDNTEGISYKTRDNVLYLATSNQSPIAAFITDGGDESAAIKVVLKPTATGPQEIILDNYGINGFQIARKTEKAMPRTDAILSIMAGVATGNLPFGYRMDRVNASYLPVCHQLGLSFDFYNGQFVSGGDYVIAIGVVENKTLQKINLLENRCYKEGVVAVSVFPFPELLPSEKAEVLVMYHRKKVSARTNNKRKSLIGD